MEYAEEANRIQNGQQNQLQGCQAVSRNCWYKTDTHTRQLIETVRREYEEFIQTTKFEYESFKTQHQQEYDTLKNDFEETKTRLFEEKKQMGQEYRVSIAIPV